MRTILWSVEASSTTTTWCTVIIAVTNTLWAGLLDRHYLSNLSISVRIRYCAGSTVSWLLFYFTQRATTNAQEHILENGVISRFAWSPNITHSNSHSSQISIRPASSWFTVINPIWHIICLNTDCAPSSAWTSAYIYPHFFTVALPILIWFPWTISLKFHSSFNLRFAYVYHNASGPRERDRVIVSFSWFLAHSSKTLPKNLFYRILTLLLFTLTFLWSSLRGSSTRVAFLLSRRNFTPFNIWIRIFNYDM